MVQQGQTAVQRRQAPTTVAGQRGEVGVGDLPVSNHAGHRDLLVTQVVRPEVVAGVGGHTGEHGHGLRGGRTFPKDETDKRTLGHWARGEGLLQRGEPFLDHVMVHVVGDAQGDEHVRVEQCGHASSSSARTSSLVTTRPNVMVVRPVRSLVPRVAGPGPPRAERSSRATVSLNDVRESRAMLVAIACRSSGRSTVVRMMTG